jgi:GT2 family glycosyltransferase
VVDNASTDDSVAAIKKAYPTQVKLIVNSENLGGSGGFNTGLKEAFSQGYQYLMCVDNDAMLEEDAVGNLVEFLDAHSEVGIAASKIYHLETPDYIQQYGQKIDFENFCTDVPDLNRREDNSQPDFRYVDAVAACSLMIRRSTIEKIGFMPEENFLYWDDTEWCYRCTLNGMKVASVGTSKAYHAMGAKAEDINTFPTYYSWRNWINFFIKYTPSDKLEKLGNSIIGSVFYEVYSGIHRGEFNRMKTIMFAFDDALNGITGKAKENRIFDIDHNYEPYRKLFESCNKFYIEEGNYPATAEWLRTLPDELKIDGIEWTDTPEPDAVTIALVESIFRIDDMSLSKIYIDIDGCIFQDEDDALDIINFNYSKRSFIAAHMPLLLEKLRAFRKGEK